MTLSGEVSDALIPLLPEQRRFLSEELPHDHFNIALLSKVHAPLNASICEAALRAAISWHPGLSVGLFSNRDHEFGQIVEVPIHFERVDLADCPDSQLGAAIEPVASRIQTSIRLTEPPLIRAAYFTTGNGRPDRLLVVIHHFVLDGFSGQLLMRDFMAACTSLLQRMQPTQAKKGTSATDWARELLRLAQSGSFDHEVDTWCKTAQRVDPFPVDDPTGANTQASLSAAIATFSPEQSDRLFAATVKAGANMRDVLAAGLFAIAEQSYGMDHLGMTLVSGGRRRLSPKLNPLRTVGWIASRHPVTLQHSASGKDIVAASREQLQSSPNDGASYNVLRYLSPREDVVGRLAALGEPELVLNYQGGLNPERMYRNASPSQALIEPALEPRGPTVTNKGFRSQHHRVQGVVIGGQLIVQWWYSKNLHRPATIEAHVEQLVATANRWAHTIS